MGFVVFLEEGRIVPDLSKIRNLFDKLRKQIIWKTAPKRSLLTRKYVFPHSPKSLISLLNQNFKSLRINFIYNKNIHSEKHDNDEVIEGIHAYLDPHHLGITVETGPMHLYSLMDPEEYENVVNSFISMIGHELIHLEQLSRRLSKAGIPPSSEDLFAYLSDPMEIQSYAWQVVNDLQDLRLSKNQALALIKNQSKLAATSTIFSLYAETFDKDSIVMRSFLKRIFQYVGDVYV